MADPVQLQQLMMILNRALEEPAALATVVREFLSAFDELPQEVVDTPGRAWEALRHVGYELQFYSPADATDDDALLDDEGALRTIREALTLMAAV